MAFNTEFVGIGKVNLALYQNLLCIRLHCFKGDFTVGQTKNE